MEENQAKRNPDALESLKRAAEDVLNDNKGELHLAFARLGFLLYKMHTTTDLDLSDEKTLKAIIRSDKYVRSVLMQLGQEPLLIESCSWAGMTMFVHGASGRYVMRFVCKPPEETIKVLNELGFRWSGKNKQWEQSCGNGDTAEKQTLSCFSIGTPTASETFEKILRSWPRSKLPSKETIAASIKEKTDD